MANMFTETSEEWIAKWDAGELVWTIEMGGISPGYEQTIQCIAAEMLRYFVTEKPDLDGGDWATIRDAMDSALKPVSEKYGPSGAQWGAARNLAAHFYRKSPKEVGDDPAVKDRHIMVSSHFPGAA